MFIEFDSEIINTESIVKIFKSLFFDRNDENKSIDYFYTIIIRLGLQRKRIDQDINNDATLEDCFAQETYKTKKDRDERWKELRVLLLN